MSASRATRLVVYGDFNCPWSYLAFRRARVLQAAGVAVDWRAVEHDRWDPARRGVETSFAALRHELDRVLAMLLPEEELPYDLAGFVPRTGPAVTAYAESRIAQVPERVGRVLFEAWWMHGIDIGDAAILRTLLVDELRGSPSPSEAVRDWGYPVDVTGGAISTWAWRLVRQWADEWQQGAKQVVPIVRGPGIDPVYGVDAVEWLGEEILERGLDPAVGELRPPYLRSRELPDLGWVSANGGRSLPCWQQQAAHAVSA